MVLLTKTLSVPNSSAIFFGVLFVACSVGISEEDVHSGKSTFFEALIGGVEGVDFVVLSELVKLPVPEVVIVVALVVVISVIGRSVDFSVSPMTVSVFSLVDDAFSVAVLVRAGAADCECSTEVVLLAVVEACFVVDLLVGGSAEEINASSVLNMSRTFLKVEVFGSGLSVFLGGLTNFVEVCWGFEVVACLGVDVVEVSIFVDADSAPCTAVFFCAVVTCSVAVFVEIDGVVLGSVFIVVVLLSDFILPVSEVVAVVFLIIVEPAVDFEVVDALIV